MTTTATESKPEKGIRMPPTLAILAVILFLAAILSQVLPPGSFKREQKTLRKAGVLMKEYVVQPGDTVESIKVTQGDDATADRGLMEADGKTPLTAVIAGTTISIPVHPTGTREVVVPGTFEYQDRRTYESSGDRAFSFLGGLLMAPLRGFQDKADVIAFILLIGGAFGIVLGTGSIDILLRYAVERLAQVGATSLIIPVLMLLFSLGGATFGMSEEVIPFVMITIPLAIRLGYDTITGLCMSFVAAGLGFAGAFFNPFTVQIAQAISDLPLASGAPYRVFVWISVTLIGIVYTMWWAGKVKRDPTVSPTYENDRQLLSTYEHSHEGTRIRASDIGVLLTLAGSIVLIMWGVVYKGWYIEELSAVLLGAGVLSAIVSRMGLTRAAELFARGAADLSGAALVVAFAAGILIIMKDGQVLDSILYWISGMLEGTHPIAGSSLMFIFQSCLNFFVPSGSGQAAMTMPIMAPLSDLMGISRQTAVLAFQFGDGFGNMIIPTSAVTMSVLGIARIPWVTWAKWILPLEAILLVAGCVFLAIAVLIGYQ
ncbi:putative basic amino acid antiporter YfcC [bacterium]|nr:putative basic amino acid antiporter YfcC [bacterium]